MRISRMRPGERYSLDCRDTTTDKPTSVTFTLLAVSWFPNETKPACFFHGAMAVTDAGMVGILDFITLECCRPLLALPAPA